ncbi:hypothetical protein [Streptosporangium sp. NPDC002721]|uniref:hypothetical protein n=1 Tax=Streptosporangium sp. NPDC002721 TaxID=3366188 RepID=UPI0036C67C5F
MPDLQGPRHLADPMTSPLRRLVARWVAQADEVLCARDDRIAERLGWQVTRTGFGARTYRDPRFDRPAPAREVPATSDRNEHHEEMTVMGQSKAERDAAIQKIKNKVCADFASDGIRPDEVVLKDNGEIVIDRRKTHPQAVPLVIGTWS